MESKQAPDPSSSVYELWFIGSAGVRPAGLVPTPDGADAVLVLASGLSSGDAIGVTVEPGGRHRRAHHHAHRGAHSPSARAG